MRVELLEAWLAAVHAIRSNAARSWLTMIGITVGVASVIVVVTIVQSLTASVVSSFDALGSNTLTVRAYTSFEKQLQGVTNRLTLQDYRVISTRVSGIKDIAPILLPFGVFGTQVRFGERSSFTRIFAITPNYQESFRTYVERGRFIGESDIDRRRKVAILGPKVVRDLEIDVNPLGEFIRISGEWYKIIGVMEEKGDIFGISQDDFILLPFSTGEVAVSDRLQLDINITLTVDRDVDIEDIQARIENILRETRNLAADEQDDFRVDTAKQLTENFDQLKDVITITAAGMVGISLLVGGIGIMNRMLTSVTERTREIGISKALGAKRSDILFQFLFEAVLLSIMGALVGVVLGVLISYGLQVIFPQLPGISIPIWSIFLSVVFCMVIGIVFGVVPAAKAANLNPIDALRHE